MTSLKCWNSGVESKDGAFITLPKGACACHARVSSCSSRAHLWFNHRKRSLADQFIVGHAATDDTANRHAETVGVVHVAPMVETERLFIQIPEQVERLHADVSSLESTLEQGPEILAAVRVDGAIDVGFGVVDDLVDVAALSRRSVAVNRESTSAVR